MKWEKCRNFLCESALLALCGLILFAAGCAVRPAKMIPAGFDISGKHPYTVKVQGRVGGKETHLRQDSLISSSAFTEALTNSILKSGLFKGVVRGEGADYLLNVVILDYNQPWLGIDFDINVETKWELSKSGQAQPFWSDTISTSYKTTLWKAFFAAERLQKANEGAVRANIQEGIKRLSALQF
jgi:hypothetical protein